MNASRKIQAADLFCGAGGTSSGLMEACTDLDLTVDLLAVNHWQVAIATHSANHPDARHMCKSIESVNPRMTVPGGKLDILVASPECTHHSNARGGKPMSDQMRASAWHICWWAETLKIDNILIENVKEFRDWGPLTDCTCGTEDPKQHSPGFNCLRPVKKRKGEFFQNFLRNLRKLGYTVDYKLLRAADYGDPTVRVRLFIQAKRGRRKITWPTITHLPPEKLGLDVFPGALPWRTAREIIDWNLPGKSIYDRPKPLAPNTMRRIIAGLQKFSGLPFVVVNRTNNAPHSVEDPVHSLTTGQNMALCTPFLVVFRNGQTAQSLDDPLKTMTAKNGGQFALVEPDLQPFLVPNFGERDGQPPRTHSVDEPLPAVTGHGAGMLVKPTIVVLRNNCDAKSVDDPLPTVAANGKHLGITQSFLVSAGGPEVGARSVDQPLNTVLTRDHMGVAEPFLVGAGGPEGQGGPHSIDEPVPTILKQNHTAVVDPFIMAMEHSTIESGDNRRCYDIDEPMRTITKKGDFGLVEPEMQPIVVNIGQTGSNGCQAYDVDEPLRTLVTQQEFAVVEPALIPLEAFIVPQGSSNAPRSVDDPLNTVMTTSRGINLIRPYLAEYHQEKEGEEPRVRSVDAPLPTQDCSNRYAICRPFLIAYYGTEKDGDSVDQPVRTISAKDRLALVESGLIEKGDKIYVLDIRFRMLKPHELAAAHSFPKDYKFDGTQDQVVAQVGNSVPVKLAKALCAEMLKYRRRK